jgi:hypothetical protein
VQAAQRQVEGLFVRTKTFELGPAAGLLVDKRGAIKAICKSSGASLWLGDKGVLSVTGSTEAIIAAVGQVLKLLDITITKGAAQSDNHRSGVPPAQQAGQRQAKAQLQTQTKAQAHVQADTPVSPQPLQPPPRPPPVQASPQTSSVRWFWQGDQGEWTQYTSEYERVLEDQYGSLATSPTGHSTLIWTFVVGRFTYQVRQTRTGHLIQLNLETGKERAVKRKGAPPRLFFSAAYC